MRLRCLFGHQHPRFIVPVRLCSRCGRTEHSCFTSPPRWKAVVLHDAGGEDGD